MSLIITIDGRDIGSNMPCYIIAEGCDNHLGNVDTAKEMIRQAKLAGADAIKFQHHLPDEEMLPDVPMSSNFNMPLYEFLQKYALTLEQHKMLMAYADEVGITYLCTPFSWQAAVELEDLGLPAYKIGSGEMTDIPTLTRISKFNKPMLISTGMANWEEIDRTYTALVDYKTSLVLMNCVSEYPPVYEDINLNVIQAMQKRYDKAIIGHSDHTPDLYTCYAAVTLGAKVIEKHVILDKRQPGPDQAVSIDFTELAQLVSGIRKIEAALGDKKEVHHKEKPIREWALRSLVSTRDIAQGEEIVDSAIWSKRPGTGIPAYKMQEVVGKKARKAIPANTLLAWEDIEA